MKESDDSACSGKVRRMWTMLSLGVEQGSVRGNLVGITCLSIDMEPAIRDIVSLIIC